jgi:P4 family phage/plasmid primase-like protien
VRDIDYTASSEFLARVFAETNAPVELRAFPNINGEPGARVAMVDAHDAAAIEAFCSRTDGPGMGVFFGVCTRLQGATSGNRETVAECPAIWVDIDCLDNKLPGDEVLSILEYLPCPPSIIVNSGGGIHAYWLLEDPAQLNGNERTRAMIEGANRTLAQVLAGDSKAIDLPRVMRLPGTHNTKDKTIALYDGEPAQCGILGGNDALYALDDLIEWLSTQRVMLVGKKPVTAARAVEENAFTAYAREAGFNPAIDIDDELAAMAHGAIGINSIHQTQLRVSMAMISRGYDDDDIVITILAATERAAPRDAKWNWTKEETAIRKMVATGRAKAEANPLPARATSNGSAALQLVHSAEPAPKAKDKPEPRDDIAMLGEAALGVWAERYGPIMLTDGTSYCYDTGVWAQWDQRHDQKLRILMQEACVRLQLVAKATLIGNATAYFMNRPSLFIDHVEFDRHGLIIAEDGTIDPSNGAIGKHSPDLHARFKVGASVHGNRDCTTFLQFLNDSFADKPEDEIPQIIGTVQEWFGACLVASKSRALAKGMLVYGGSRTGKTQLSEVLRALLGKGQTSACRAADIGGDFGLQPFLNKRGWVADDAIGQDEFLDAENYKKIVTGEEIDVRRKNHVNVITRFGFPVMLTANHLPKVKDQSDAVYNRSLVLPMTRVRSEKLPEPAGYDSISAKIIAEELSGVLWWAFEGWQRLKARGTFTVPASMTKAIDELQDNNNTLRQWIKECVETDDATKVANADLFASFAGWYYQENGEGRFPWSQNGFVRKLKEAMPLLGYQKTVQGRALTGLRLNDDGKEYWSINAARDSLNKPRGKAADVHEVNQSYDAVKAARTTEQHAAAAPIAPTDRTPRF